MPHGPWRKPPASPCNIPPYVLQLYSHVQHVGRDAHTWMIGQLKGLDISRTG